MLRLIRAIRVTPLWRQFVDSKDLRAKLEQDAYDNPYLDVENKTPSHRKLQPVEPFPRRKLKELYILALERFKDLPPTAGYRLLMEEMTRYRLKVVEDNEDIETIEKTIGYGNVDDLIEAAKNELICCDHMKREKPWEVRTAHYDMFEETSTESIFGDHPYEATEEKPKNTR